MVGNLSQNDLLLPLREDLHLYKSLDKDNGEPTWVIFDQTNGYFYKIGAIEFEILSRWDSLDKEKILRDCQTNTPFFPTNDDFEQLLEFLKEKRLLLPSKDESNDLYVKSLSIKQSLFQKFIKNYLFFRIPFAHPNQFLNKLTGIADLVFHKNIIYLIGFLLLLNSILFAKNMDIFASYLSKPFEHINFLYISIALIIVKLFHEFGHMLACVKNNVKVPNIGVSFIVMCPMLYVDTSESWKIDNNKKRLAVSSAGIMSEFLLALICFPLFFLFNDEAIKTLLLYISLSSLSISLLLNASPFMRFDGYFILQDILKEENLHDKAFDAFKNKLRNFFFSVDTPITVSKKKNLFYALFGFATFIYRATVYLGIAFAVYYMTIKALGIILFLIEVYYFLLLPLIKEGKIYKQLYLFMSPENKKSFYKKVLIILSFILILPLFSTIKTTGYIVPENYREIYAPFSGKVKYKTDKANVKKGDLLLTIENFDLSMQQEALQSNSAYAKEYYKKIQVSDKELKNLMAAQNQINIKDAAGNLNQNKLAKLEIKADFDGIVTDFSESLNEEIYVSKDELLGLYYNPNSWTIYGFVTEEQLDYIQVNDDVHFYLAGSSINKIDGKISFIHKTPILYLPNILMVDKNDPNFVLEDVKSDKRLKNSLKNKKSLYKIEVKVDSKIDYNQMKKGNLVIKTNYFYYIFTYGKRLISNVIKEIGVS